MPDRGHPSVHSGMRSLRIETIEMLNRAVE